MLMVEADGLQWMVTNRATAARRLEPQPRRRANGGGVSLLIWIFSRFLDDDLGTLHRRTFSPPRVSAGGGEDG